MSLILFYYLNSLQGPKLRPLCLQLIRTSFSGSSLSTALMRHKGILSGKMLMKTLIRKCLPCFNDCLLKEYPAKKNCLNCSIKIISATSARDCPRVAAMKNNNRYTCVEKNMPIFWGSKTLSPTSVFEVMVFYVYRELYEFWHSPNRQTWIQAFEWQKALLKEKITENVFSRRGPKDVVQHHSVNMLASMHSVCNIVLQNKLQSTKY